MSRALARAGLVALLLALVGCGFQLRRELVLPAELSTIAVEAEDPNAPLVRGLAQALRRAGADVRDSAIDGIAVLRIASAALAQRPLSIGGGGRVQEFALGYRVEVELVDATGTVRLPRQTVNLERVFSFDTAEALGTPGEQEIVAAELEREMVAALLRRIEAAVR